MSTNQSTSSESQAAAARWLSDIGMADPNDQPWELSSLDQLMTSNMWDDGLHKTLSSESYSLNLSSNTRSSGSSIDSSHADGGGAIAVQRPKEMTRTDSWDSFPAAQKSTILPPTASSPSILSFGNPDSHGDSSRELYKKMLVGVSSLKRSHDDMAASQGQKKAAAAAASRHSTPNQVHILAERKRREKLSQSLIALSAIVPGLKKMDKASVLGDAIKYLKALQEKVKSLEEQAAKRTVESAVLVKKSQLTAGAADDNDMSSSDESLNRGVAACQSSLPAIEVKLSDKTVLIKIHCEGRKGMLVRALSEIEQLHLAVLSTSAMPFAAASLDVTVMAQIEEGFCMTVKDLVRQLSSALRQFM